MDVDVDVAGSAAERPRVPLARDADALPVVDAGRNLDVKGLLLHRSSRTAAGLAGMLDDVSSAAAGGAGLRADELAERAVLDVTEAPGAGARRARGRLRARREARSATRRAGNRDGVADVARRSPSRIDEVDLHLCADVGAALTPRPADAEQIVAEERRKEVGETADVERGRSVAAAAEPGVAEAVVEVTGLGLR